MWVLTIMQDMKYSPEFIFAVNRIFHDVEAEHYEKRHPEIFVDEISRWQRNIEKFLRKRSAPVVVLDVGSGTGFVPLQICPHLKQEDKFICSDISEQMLLVCRKNILVKNFCCKLIFQKLEESGFDMDPGSLDCITMNSVLHHVPNWAKFFGEINLMLKKDGCIIIGHEPSSLFFKTRLLMANYQILNYFYHPRLVVSKFLRMVGLYSFVARLVEPFFHDVICEEVNKRLLKKGLISSSLSPGELTAIVDIHSPGAGGYYENRGINVDEIIKKFLPNFTIEHLETYNHLNEISSYNRFTRWYDSLLRTRFPGLGATVFVVMRKIR